MHDDNTADVPPSALTDVPALDRRDFLRAATVGMGAMAAAGCATAMPAISATPVPGIAPAKLDTGFDIMIPIFVDQGEWVRVDTRDGSYKERVKVTK